MKPVTFLIVDLVLTLSTGFALVFLPRTLLQVFLTSALSATQLCPNTSTLLDAMVPLVRMVGIAEFTTVMFLVAAVRMNNEVREAASQANSWRFFFFNKINFFKTG